MQLIRTDILDLLHASKCVRVGGDDSKCIARTDMQSEGARSSLSPPPARGV
jgi:hypothetical protein